MPLTFDGIPVVVESVRVKGSQPWTEYVRLRAADAVGWYGPVPNRSARGARKLAAIAGRLDGHDHAGTHRALLATCVSNGDLAALGALDAAFWDLDARLSGCDLAAALGAVDKTSEAPGYASLLPIDLRLHDSSAKIMSFVDDATSLAKFGIRVDGFRDEQDLRATWAQQAERALGLLPHSAFDFWGKLDESTASVITRSSPADKAVWLEDLMVPYDRGAYQRISKAAPEVSLGLGEYPFDLEDHLPAWVGSLGPHPAFTLDPISCGGITRALELLNTAVGAGCHVYLHGRHLRVAAAIAMARPQQVQGVEVQLIWEIERSVLHRHQISATGSLVARMSVNGIGAEPPNV